jgi:hypothetical protein
VRTGGVETLSSETQAIKTIGAFTALELLNVQRDKDMLLRLRLIEIARGCGALDMAHRWRILALPLDRRRFRCVRSKAEPDASDPLRARTG